MHSTTKTTHAAPAMAMHMPMAMRGPGGGLLVGAIVSG
jgi:hypothetical protein